MKSTKKKLILIIIMPMMMVLAMMPGMAFAESAQSEISWAKSSYRTNINKANGAYLNNVVDDKFIASPLARGAGAAMSLVRADGFCIIEQIMGVAGQCSCVEICRSAHSGLLVLMKQGIA